MSNKSTGRGDRGGVLLARGVHHARLAVPLALAVGVVPFILGPRHALAHGPAPATLGVPHGASLADGVVRLSSGAAVQDEQGQWVYLCPASWGGPGAPAMIASEQGIWVLGNDGPALWNGGWERAYEGELGSVQDVTHAHGEAWILAREDQAAGGSTSLLSLDSDRTVSLSRPWSAVTGLEQGFAVAQLDDDALEVAWLDEGVETKVETRVETRVERVALARPATSVDLRHASDELYVVLSRPDDYEVARITSGDLSALATDLGEGSSVVATDDRLRSPAPIDGPVGWGDATLVASDGALLTWQDGQLEPR